ncbi:PQQ-binding-like beta-propeller repeat protein [Streptomyces sp. NA04227]|uniref:outer membrane protein assembly factor BamB family protein n=1 Tax=Streptomyces sp. NA04227 TaxID=2742136 RepID=UPI001590CEC1|nr:PQQ-binding-like beta-propeller repeat protein [Streptomyces sp. NA04227]QKW07587.1 PQQ-binding-like beta-propeller repeat protein [Streptomyces sp. NA04227]
MSPSANLNPYAQASGSPQPPPTQVVPIGVAGGGGNGNGNGNGRQGAPRGRLITLLAGAVAVLVLLGVGGYVLSGGDDDKEPGRPSAGDSAPGPSSSEGGDGAKDKNRDDEDGKGEERKKPDLNAGSRPGDATAWAAWNPDNSLPGESTLLNDLWVVGDTYVQAVHKEVVAYRASDGRKVWSVPLPGPVCDTPVNPTPDGKVVVAYTNGKQRPATRCNQLRLIDLKTGTAGWRKPLGEADDLIITHLAISGGTVAVSAGSSSTAYRVEDGERLFTTGRDTSGKATGGKGTLTCVPDDVAGGARLLQVDVCSGQGSPVRGGLRELDPRSGEVRWRYRSEGAWKIDKVVSVEPLVLIETEAKNVLRWRVIALDAKGERRSVPDLARIAKHDFRACGGSGDAGEGVQNCPGTAVDANTLALAQDNKLAVFDLDSGKMRWGTQWNDGNAMVPLLLTGGRVTVYQAATLSKPGRTVEFGPKGGEPKVLLRHPSGAAETEYATLAGRVLYERGRLVLAPTTLDGSDRELKARLISFAGAPAA